MCARLQVGNKPSLYNMATSHLFRSLGFPKWATELTPVRSTAFGGAGAWCGLLWPAMDLTGQPKAAPGQPSTTQKPSFDKPQILLFFPSQNAQSGHLGPFWTKKCDFSEFGEPGVQGNLEATPKQPCWNTHTAKGHRSHVAWGVYSCSVRAVTW